MYQWLQSMVRVALIVVNKVIELSVLTLESGTGSHHSVAVCVLFRRFAVKPNNTKLLRPSCYFSH